MSELDITPCPECHAPVALVARGAHHGFACGGCGGMFEPRVLIGRELERLVELIERESRIARASVAAATTLEDAARAHELFFGPRTFEPIDAVEAHLILAHLISTDMAYSSSLMQADGAGRCAAALLRPLLAIDSRFYTNRRWSADRGRLASGWTPATGATFDCGVLAIAGELSACVWFEDED